MNNNDPFTFLGDGQTYSDPKVFDTCVGGPRARATGEGPWTRPRDLPERDDPGPNGPVACPTNDLNSGAMCEFADGYCFQKGTRTATVNGVPVTSRRGELVLRGPVPER